MAHQAHNISYSRYQKIMDYRYTEIMNGSNHKHMPNFEKDKEFLKNEFVENIIEFATSLKQKIKESDIYLDNEYEKIMLEYISVLEKKDIYIYHLTFVPLEQINEKKYENNLEDQLFITILNGDIKLIKTFIVALTTKTKSYKPSSFSENHSYGQFWVGGLAESFHSFIFSYLLLNTYLSYENNLKNTIIKFKNVVNYSSGGGAFEYSCNLLNDYILKLFRQHAQKLIYNKDDKDYAIDKDEFYGNSKKYYIAILCTMDPEFIRELLKEMFRIMYYSFAMMTYDSDDITKPIEKIKYSYDRCVHF
jgi:hypothetical protein